MMSIAQGAVATSAEVCIFTHAFCGRVIAIGSLRVLSICLSGICTSCGRMYTI